MSHRGCQGLCQGGKELPHRHGMLIVGLLPQHPEQDQELLLLIGVPRHGTFPLSPPILPQSQSDKQDFLAPCRNLYGM